MLPEVQRPLDCRSGFDALAEHEGDWIHLEWIEGRWQRVYSCEEPGYE